MLVEGEGDADVDTLEDGEEAVLGEGEGDADVDMLEDAEELVEPEAVAVYEQDGVRVELAEPDEDAVAYGAVSAGVAAAAPQDGVAEEDAVLEAVAV
jgi:hypothetical protein